MSDKVTYQTFTVSATEALTVNEGAKAPKIIITAHEENWPADDVEGLRIDVWRREKMKKYNNKTAVVVCQPF